MAKYTVEIHGPNAVWTFYNVEQSAVDKIKTAAVGQSSFSVSKNGTDYTFNSTMLVGVFFTLSSDPWAL